MHAEAALEVVLVVQVLKCLIIQEFGAMEVGGAESLRLLETLLRLERCTY